MTAETKIIGRITQDDGTKVIFPIKRNVVVYGHEYEKSIDKGAQVRCRMCRRKLVISNMNTFNFEGMQYVQCWDCGAKVSILYYFGKEIVEDEKQERGKGKEIRSYVG